MSTLLISVSGIRGIVGSGLDPEALVKYVSAYADFIGKGKIVIGRDSRISGEMVKAIVIGTLSAKGLSAIDIGIVPTPTVQFAVKNLKAAGGIAVSASHNPNEWNALKLLNRTGQFLSLKENNRLQKILSEKPAGFKAWNRLGVISQYKNAAADHINAIEKLEHINFDRIRERKFRVLLDCVNGAGAFVLPDYLKYLGCEVILMNCSQTGIFPRLPEPIPQNLKKTFKRVKEENVDLGIVVDPDVDRLVLVTEQGEPFGEENTIVQAVKFALSKRRGNVVVNLSTTRGVDDAAAEFNCRVYRTPVGEANVVKKMKSVKAVIGGEGSGGVIYPDLHYGRDALVGIAVTLQHLLEYGGRLSSLKKNLPCYYIAKRKIEIKNINPDVIIKKLIGKYKKHKTNTEDGLKIDFEDHWVHFRKSNTEPIIRIITEAKESVHAEKLSKKYMNEIKSIMQRKKLKA